MIKKIPENNQPPEFDDNKLKKQAEALISFISLIENNQKLDTELELGTFNILGKDLQEDITKVIEYQNRRSICSISKGSQSIFRKTL